MGLDLRARIRRDNLDKLLAGGEIEHRQFDNITFYTDAGFEATFQIIDIERIPIGKKLDIFSAHRDVPWKMAEPIYKMTLLKTNDKENRQAGLHIKE